MRREFLLLIFFFIGTMIGGTSMNNLTKVYRHEGVLGDQVVCYFTDEPVCNLWPVRPELETTKGGQLVFFLPMTMFKGADVKNMVAKINGAKRPFYSASMEEVQAPILGIKLVFTFDPKQAEVSYEKFDAITTAKGLIFSIYDKNQLKLIKERTASLLQLAHNDSKKATIVIDCGHGGNDTGKIGCFGIQEKHITLQIGMQLADQLQRDGYKVLLTRNDDRYIPLDERTAFANKVQADALISLHANAAGPEHVGGLETFCIEPSLFVQGDKSLPKDPTIHDYLKTRDTLSYALAQSVHTNILSHTQPVYQLHDRSIKKSVTQVLHGAQMPAVLVELGFLSNPQESQFLSSVTSQQLISQGILSGINSFFAGKKAV